MATKKQAQPADLPKTKSTEYDKRTKQARAAAKAKIEGGYQAEGVGNGPPAMSPKGGTGAKRDRQVKAATVIGIDTQVVDGTAQTSATLHEIAIEDFALEQETAAAVADLDVDPEVVRTLADVGLDDDPFGFDDMPSDINAKDEEAAAAARLDRKWAPGKTVTLNVGVGYAGPGVMLPGKTSIADEFADQVSGSSFFEGEVLGLQETIADLQRLLATRNAEIERFRGRQTADEKTIAHLDSKLRDYKDDLDRTIKSLNLEQDEHNQAKRDLTRARKDAATAINDLQRQRDLNARYYRAIDVAAVRPPFWARVRAVFVNPRGKGATP